MIVFSELQTIPFPFKVGGSGFGIFSSIREVIGQQPVSARSHKTCLPKHSLHCTILYSQDSAIITAAIREKEVVIPGTRARITLNRGGLSATRGIPMISEIG